MKTLAIARRSLVIGLCGYEVISVASGRMPPITVLCERYRALAPALVLALAVHLAWQPPVIVVPASGDCLLCPEPF